MQRFLLRRLIFTVLSLIGATAIVFGLSRLQGDPLLLYATPGYGLSPAQQQALTEKLRLDKPLAVQYLYWLGDILQGDFGDSLLDRRPVTTTLSAKWGNTFQLAIAGMLVAVLIGVPLGVLSAVKRGSYMDYFGRTFALFGLATPAFWVGIMAIYLFSVKWQVLPAGTKYTYETFPLAWDNVKHFIMPAFFLGWGPAAGLLRITRSAMLDTLDSEFIKLARAKGVSYNKVIWKHALKNAAIPPLTVISLMMAGFITGTVVIEQVFAWPGIGNLAVQAVFNNDYPLMTGIVLIFVAIYMVVNFAADMLYAVIDPRIRYD
jgi:peptide/nickel transport system permease protein